jgi:glycolate oxidase
MIPKDIIRSLGDIVGTEGIHYGKEALLCYSYDATQIEHLPDLVIMPTSADQISKILKIANRERIPVVPRGAGSGFSGGSIPVKGGIVLSLERMNKILEFDEEDLIAVVEPGVVLGRFHRLVESKGLFYPPDPSSSDFCTIGGNVAENASGPRSMKYGGTRNYVLGLEAILPDGRVFKTGARTVKSVAGYDLTRLMVGSEGTLGVVTKITLRLLPLPEDISTMMVYFPGITDNFIEIDPQGTRIYGFGVR